jgi:hypothetical protein
MIENISRYIEEGMDPMQASLVGAEQIGFTILSLTVSLIAVLIPLLFMGDVVGRLFREFAVTLSVTILVSAVVSLTLTPMMCARLLHHRKPEEQGWFYRVSERGFERVIDFYARTLSVVLRHQPATRVVAVGTLIATILLYVAIPKGFFPVQDTGVILGISEAAQSVSFPAMAERQQAMARVILQDPAVASLSSFIGVDGVNTTVNSGRIQINLKPLEERASSATEVIRRLQPRLAAVEGITLFMQPVQDLTVEDRVSRTQFQYSLEDADAGELSTWVPQVVARLQSLPMLRDVASDQQNLGRQVVLTCQLQGLLLPGIVPLHLFLFVKVVPVLEWEGFPITRDFAERHVHLHFGVVDSIGQVILEKLRVVAHNGRTRRNYHRPDRAEGFTSPRLGGILDGFDKHCLFGILFSLLLESGTDPRERALRDHGQEREQYLGFQRVSLGFLVQSIVVGLPGGFVGRANVRRRDQPALGLRHDFVAEFVEAETGPLSNVLSPLVLLDRQDCFSILRPARSKFLESLLAYLLGRF